MAVYEEGWIGPAELTILHTNDFHNRLSEAQAQRLRLLHESAGEAGLLLDAGDAIGAGNVTFRPGGEPILEQMTQIGYAAMTVGNREFHFSRVGFHSKLSRAAFPVLCANVRLNRSSNAPPSEGDEKSSRAKDPPVVPSIVLNLANGWRIVVFGLTVPMITERMLSRQVSAYVFDDPLKTAAELVPRLRREFSPDLLIALTHIGIAKDRQIATEVSGIDLILGGHTHVVLEHGEWIGTTLIAQAGSHGRFVGRVDASRAEPTGTVRLRASLERL